MSTAEVAEPTPFQEIYAACRDMLPHLAVLERHGVNVRGLLLDKHSGHTLQRIIGDEDDKTEIEFAGLHWTWPERGDNHIG